MMKKLLTPFLIGMSALVNLPLALHGSVANALGHSAEHSPGPIGEPWVYDATGKPVGQYSNGAAVISIGDARIFVRLARIASGSASNPALSKWDPPTPTPRWWPSADCSGPPYVVPFVLDYQIPGRPPYFSVAGEPAERPATFVRDTSGDLIAYIAPSGPTTLQPYHSFLEGNQCVQRDAAVRAWIAERSINITKLYPEPLTVRAD